MNPDAQSNHAGAAQTGQRVLDCEACTGRMAEVTAFENAHFGELFTWTVEQNRHWADLPAAVHAAVTEDERIVASMSVLLVEPNSCRRLITAEIKEIELQPWTGNSAWRCPILYFGTVIAPSRAYVSMLYASLARDTSNLLCRHRLQPSEGLAIAASEPGRLHLERNGFRRLNAQYQCKHHFMRITARYAQTGFWRDVFNTPQPVMTTPHPFVFPTQSPFTP